MTDALTAIQEVELPLINSDQGQYVETNPYPYLFFEGIRRQVSDVVVGELQESQLLVLVECFSCYYLER